MSDGGNSDNGVSGPDIVTYIGVPLAVLGVLPIMYNTVATLAALQKIKRMLKHSKLTAMTRSDVVNRVIEVELPRYAVTPLDRFEERTDYWQLPRTPSEIPGGSWTRFNWKSHTIGFKTQRVEYADQLRQPQVEVAFDELIAYLLDLGAVPDPLGWKLLRSTGLWTPVGCSLMKSPDGHFRALAIAPLDDSDGHLSLSANWSSDWTTRDFLSLPPYWVRLPPPPEMPTVEPETGEASGSKEADTQEEPPATAEEEDTGAQEDAMTGEEAALMREKARKSKGKDDDINSMSRQSLDSIEKQANKSAKAVITCQISVDGLVSALCQENDLSFSSANLHSLYIEHLRIRTDKQDGVWFASAATAYGTTNQTVLWNYKIPDEVLNFARKDTIPCGVLVLLAMVEEADTPEWATKHDDGSEDHERMLRRSEDRFQSMMAEGRMTPDQRVIAQRERMQKESRQMLQDMRDRQRRDQQRRDQRLSEALQSPKWEPKLVAEHTLFWLKQRGQFPADFALKDAAGTMLHRMILTGEYAGAVCKMLDLWKTWADNGGMRRTDFDALQADPETFAMASLLVAMIKDTTGAHEGSLSMDLQECLRMWRTVRLG